MDTSLPQRFLEQSIHSLRQVRNQTFQLNQQTIQQDTQFENYPMTLQLKRQPLALMSRSKETLIAAVDTSTIKIGETSTGIIIAVRGANVWKQNRAYRYKRLGPFIFHITEDNKKEVFNSLEKAYFNTQYASSHQSTPNLLQMPTRIASLLERWLQAMIAKTATNGVLLFDGSLTSGTIDTPVQRMREILTTARRHGNIVLAFSKATSLRSNGKAAGSTISAPWQRTPYPTPVSRRRRGPRWASGCGAPNRMASGWNSVTWRAIQRRVCRVGQRKRRWPRNTPGTAAAPR